MRAISASTFSVRIAKVGGLRQQIADLAQEALVAGRIERLAGAAAVLRVDPSLQLVAPVEQRAVARREVAHQRGKPFQKASEATPVPGSTSSSMKDRSTPATLIPIPFMA